MFSSCFFDAGIRAAAVFSIFGAQPLSSPGGKSLRRMLVRSVRFPRWFSVSIVVKRDARSEERETAFYISPCSHSTFYELHSLDLYEMRLSSHDQREREETRESKGGGIRKLGANDLFPFFPSPELIQPPSPLPFHGTKVLFLYLSVSSFLWRISL